MENAWVIFSEIYDEQVNRIYRFIFLKVSSAEIAEDLTSDVFLRVWKSVSGEQSKEIENIQAYIYQIARHVLADHYRSGRHMHLYSIELVNQISDSDVGGNTMVEEVASNLEIEKVKEALLELKDEYQNYIIWRYIDEFTIAEIVEITGKSAQSVRVGIHRALQAVRQKLDKEKSLFLAHPSIVKA